MESADPSKTMPPPTTLQGEAKDCQRPPSALSSNLPSNRSIASSVAKSSTAQANSKLPKHHWCKHWGNTSHRSNSKSRNSSSRAVWAGRILFVCVLCTVAFLLGFLAYRLLTQDEASLAETQFRSISQRALVAARAGLLARRWAGVTLASFVSELYPSATQWPFVEWEGFEQVVNSMLQTSHGHDMGFVPFVTPAQLPEFESFAQKTYQKLGFPNNTGVTEAGFGVWAHNKTVTPPVPYHDTTAETPYNSSYEILAPIFRTDEGYHPVLLFNPHSQKFTGDAIDRLLTCSDMRRAKYQDALDDLEVEATNSSTYTLLTVMPPNQCGAITDIFHNIKLGGKWSVANFLPIYPLQDPLTVVGYIPSIFIVHELLENVFSEGVSGIDAVFESDARSVSYTIVNGVAKDVGEGQIFDRKYENQRQCIQMIDSDLQTDDGLPPKSFKFCVSPNDDFYEVYQTENPTVATIVVVLSIVVTIFVFLVYDFFVRREFHAKGELLEARRQFMRFVSHEVRTPLNAVSMGLDLMQSEVAQALGFDTATCFQVSHEYDEKHLQSNVNLDSMEKGHDETAPLVLFQQLSKPHMSHKPGGKVGVDTQAGSKNPVVPVSSASPSSTTTINSTISPQKAREWFQLTQEIQGNAQGAVDILNDLLNYDKIEQGTLNLGLDVLSVWTLLETAILEFKLPASSKQVQLSVSFTQEELHAQNQPPAVPRARNLPSDIRNLKVIGDSVRLTQVLRNLMSNALKFTSEGGSVEVEARYLPPFKVHESHGLLFKTSRERTIELQKGRSVTGTEQGQIQVKVTDTGAGMSQDQLARLFQDGVQFNVNELQAGGGSGLGLYIAKGIVEQHEGHLTASSDGIGHGTCFTMVLPLWSLSSERSMSEGSSDKADLEAVRSFDKCGSPEAKQRAQLSGDVIANAPSAPTVMLSPSKNTPSLHVLVVDDVKSNRKLLMRLLENNGHKCSEAEDGSVAVQMVKEAALSGHAYNCILLDYEMPILNGPDGKTTLLTV